MKIVDDLDLWCVTDIQDTGAEASGYLAFSQSLARRLITTRGTLIDDPLYGIDVREWLNVERTERNRTRLEASVTSELMKDERVASVTVDAAYVGDAISLKVKVTGTELDVIFTLNVSDVTIELLTVNT